jgi:hypothetical protein
LSAFLHAPIAWAALALAAIPIIIHLINRQRLRRLDWAAMEFLLAALKRTRRRIRLEQLLLLLTRVTLMALIALFLARPLLSDRGLGWLAGALRSEEKIFVLDDSMSMGRLELDRSAFDRARAALTHELEVLVQQRSRDRVTLLVSSRPESPLARGAFLDRDRVAQLEQALGTLSPTSTSLKLEEVLDRVAEYAAGATADSARPRAVSILSDLRARDWTDGAAGAAKPNANAGLKKALERLSKSPENPAGLIVFDVGSDDESNLAISGVAIEGGQPTANIPTDIRVQVRNAGRTALRGLRLKMSYAPVQETARQGPEAASTALAPPLEVVEAGATAVASLSPTFLVPGQYWASVEVSGARDPLAADNRAFFTLDVVEKTEVLLVNGEPSAELFEGETDHLAFALSPPGEMATGIDPVIVTEETLPRSDLSRYACVYLANVSSVPEDFRRRLERFVAGGGCLVVFLGDGVRPGVYSRELGEAVQAAEAGSQGLLPARIRELPAGEEKEVALLPVTTHPYFQLLRDRGADALLKMVGFRRYFELEPLPASQVIARFDDGRGRGGSPAIVEGSIGTGRVIVFATTADAEWHDWPANPSYLILLQEMQKTVGRSHTRESPTIAGSPLRVPVDITVHSNRAAYRTPDYPRTPEAELLAASVTDAVGATAGGTIAGRSTAGGANTDGSDFAFEVKGKDTLHAGHVFLGLEPRGAAAGQRSWRAFAVRSDPSESDLRRIDAATLRELYPDTPIEVVSDASRFSEAGRGRFEVADLLIALFIVLLFVEGALACWFAHHRRSEAQGAVAVHSPAAGRRP